MYADSERETPMRIARKRKKTPASNLHHFPVDFSPETAAFIAAAAADVAPAALLLLRGLLGMLLCLRVPHLAKGRFQ